MEKIKKHVLYCSGWRREASVEEKLGGQFPLRASNLQMANLFMNKWLRQAGSLKRPSGFKGGIKRDAVVFDVATDFSL